MNLNKKKKMIFIAGFLVSSLVWVLFYAVRETPQVFSLLISAVLITFSYTAMIFDINTKQIPNRIIVLMITAWVLIISIMMFFDINLAIKTLTDSALGFLLGGGLFFLVYLLSRKGLGGGDVKFMAAAGLYLGFNATVPAILYGTILAALTGSTLILLKKLDRKDTMPLIPFLFAGIMIVSVI